MKSVSIALGSVIALLGPIASPAQPGPLQAGAAAVDITPREFPINMPGGFSPKPAEAAHDPLHARTILLSDGKTTLSLTVADSLGAGPEVLDEAKALAAEATGMTVENMLVSSTHTHSGAPSGRKEGRPAEVAYRTVFVQGVADSIIRAHQALKPAAFGVASHPLPDEVFNRRWYLQPGKMPPNPFGKMDAVKMNPGTNPDLLDRPAGPTDPDITVLSIHTDRNRPMAMLANYALHYVGGAPKGLLSADYFGEFARLMPSRVRGSEDFVAMMSNGASGDINNIPFTVIRPPREPFEQIRIVARKAADTAWTAWKKISKHDASATLGMRQREVTLNYRRPTAEQIAEAEAVLAVKDENEVRNLPRLAQNYARGTLNAAARSEKTVDVTIQAVRIGDFAIVSLPFEVLVEIGLDLKERSPFDRTMVIGLANGRLGYLPPPEQHELGGYETWLGTSKVQKDASVILTNQLLEMLAELRAE